MGVTRQQRARREAIAALKRRRKGWRRTWREALKAGNADAACRSLIECDKLTEQIAALETPPPDARAIDQAAANAAIGEAFGAGGPMLDTWRTALGFQRRADNAQRVVVHAKFDELDTSAGEIDLAHVAWLIVQVDAAGKLEELAAECARQRSNRERKQLAEPTEGDSLEEGAEPAAEPGPGAEDSDADTWPDEETEAESAEAGDGERGSDEPGE